MGKNKLRKFAEMQEFPCVLQYPYARLQAEGFPLRGRWGRDFFHNDNPIVLELGCGRGEYTVGLARRYPDKNFIGIDIKGARIYTGARQVHEQQIPNAAFLRASIENITSFFAPEEVSEIWITFPDPQMKHTRRRLTSARFLTLYQNILVPGGEVRLKTDSPFLYTFTGRLAWQNALLVTGECPNLYGTDAPLPWLEPLREIRTAYEQQWLARGKQIRYLSFALPPLGETLTDPEEDDIPRDDYRAIPRPNFPTLP